MAAPNHESFSALLARLADERRLSQVSHESWDTGVKGTSAAMLRKIREGKRLPNTSIIEAVADLVGVKPASFPEYDLARARRALDEAARALDENAQGLQDALANYAGMREAVKRLEDVVVPPAQGRGAQKLADHARKTLGQRRSGSRGEAGAHEGNGQ